MCLDQQISHNVEAYIDDVVVKSKTTNNLITDLEEMFANLKRYRWKLNPSKCIFRVPSGILLGYIVSAHGIEPNPNKVSTITNMKRPTCVKDIQKLTGCMAALSRFISRLGEKGTTFLQTSQGLRALFLVGRGRHSFRAAQVVPNKASDHDGAMAR